jgi:hypothetical protein
MNQVNQLSKSSEAMARFLSTSDIITMLLLRLTPKEAAPLTASCKALYAQKDDDKHIDAEQYARYWHSEYNKIFMSIIGSMESVGKCLTQNYPFEKLSNITIVMSNFQWLVAEDGNSAQTYINEIKINFYIKKNSSRKAKAIYCYSHVLFEGEYSELPDSIVVVHRRL